MNKLDGFRNCERITYRCCGGLHKHLFLCRPCLFSSIVLRFISSSQVFLVQEDQQHRAYPILFAIYYEMMVVLLNQIDFLKSTLLHVPSYFSIVKRIFV